MQHHSKTHYAPLRLKKIKLSRHAAKRSQQCAIPSKALPLLLAYGERNQDGRGGVRYMMTHTSLNANATP